MKLIDVPMESTYLLASPLPLPDVFPPIVYRHSMSGGRNSIVERFCSLHATTMPITLLEDWGFNRELDR